MYITLKLDDSECRIHSISDDGPSGPGVADSPHENEEIVTNQKYVVMPWKMVSRHGKNMTLKEAVEEIKAHKEDRKLVFKFEAEHRDEIGEILGLIDYIDNRYIEEKFSEIYKFGPKRLGIHLENQLVIESYTTDFLINRGYNQLDYFKKAIRAYQRRDEDAFKHVKKVKALIDKPLDEIELEDIMLAMKKVKCLHKLDISVFYQLTRRLLHEDLDYDDERFLIHFYDTFMAASIKLLGKADRYRVNVLYHLLPKIGKEPNADLFQFMKEASHQRTEEEINFVFERLGWSYCPVQLVLYLNLCMR